MAKPSKPMDISFIEPVIEDTSKKVNKAYLITRQVDRIAQARTLNHSDIFIGGVKALMYMLTKEIEEDQKIAKEIDQLKQLKINLIKKVNPSERGDASQFYEFQMMEKIFELLMVMMRRAGITPEREIGEIPSEDVLEDFEND
jgi:hypothetical protein